MALFKTLRSHHLSSLLRLQITSPSSQSPPNPCRVTSFLTSSHFQRNFSVYALSVSPDVTEEEPDAAKSTNPSDEMEKTKKPLSVMFKDAVGLSEKQGESETPDVESGQAMSIEVDELKKRLLDLEREVKRLKGISKEKKKLQTDKKGEGKKNSSSAGGEGVPRGKPRKVASSKSSSDSKEEPEEITKRDKLYNVKELEPLEKLSPELLVLVNRLYEDGYFKTANFMPPNKLDLSYFSNLYSRDFLRSAAERFGRDNQELIKTLSFDDLKRIALFGCPSVIKRTTFSAKRLRAFFHIREDTVCGTCVMKSSCDYSYQRLWRKGTLNLSDVMRILTLYALEMVPEELEVPAEVKDSVAKLLKEVVIPNVNVVKEVVVPIEDAVKEVVPTEDVVKEVVLPMDSAV